VDLIITPTTNAIQNGADAVALYQASAATFPNGSAPTTTDLVDAIVYDTNDDDDSGLLTGLGASTQYNEDENGNKDNESISRNADGSETIVVQLATPGTLNAGGGDVTNTLSMTANGEDLIEEKVTDGSLDIGSSDLELGNEDVNEGVASDPQIVGTRFQSIIPAGATIESAYIQFVVDENDKNVSPADITITIEEVDDSEPFGTSNGELSDRTASTTTVSWSIPDWSTSDNGDAGEDQRTADISSLIQLVVDRDGYELGNSITFFFEGTGTRTAEAASDPPTLVVEATAPEDDFISVGNSINSFTFEAGNNTQLSEDVVAAETFDGNFVAVVPAGTDLSDLTPTIDISDDASIFPMASSTTDFRAPIRYTVTSELGESVAYTVTVVEEVFTETFETDPFAGDWTQFSVDGDQTWAWSDEFENISMSAFDAGCNVNEDWLISPDAKMRATAACLICEDRH
jgi:hypothetical protein